MTLYLRMESIFSVAPHDNDDLGILKYINLLLQIERETTYIFLCNQVNILHNVLSY